MANKVAEIITERILKKLEQGIIPWRKPWAGSKGAVSHATGKPYSLVNQLLLDCGGEYITFNELQKEGGKIRKGAKALPVVFWKMYEKEDKETGEVETIPVLRYYKVFDVADCEGIEPKYNTENPVKHADKDGYAESIINYYISREKITLNREQASGKAFYRPADDSITVPAINQFQHTAEYYSTLFHEMTHSTGHASRLNRLTKVAAFGSETYSKEELVAEIGAACLVNKCGLETESSFANSAAYIQSWAKALKDDPNLFISAAGKAEKAFNFIIDGLPEEQPEQEQSKGGTRAARFDINEDLARRAKENRSFFDYKPGSATAEYNGLIAEAERIAANQKNRVDPMYHDKIDALLDAYSKKIAGYINKENEISCRCPSIMIAGGSNFPVQKKEKQIAAWDRNHEEYKKAESILDKIKGVGMGGISSDDPDAIEKLTAKLEERKRLQQHMKDKNAEFRRTHTKEECKHAAAYPGWALSNNNAEIHRLQKRIEELTHAQESPLQGWEFGGGQVVANKNEGRLQILFDEKPDEETRKKLKEYGFKWSPRCKAWQRLLNDNAIRAAKLALA